MSSFANDVNSVAVCSYAEKTAIILKKYCRWLRSVATRQRSVQISIMRISKEIIVFYKSLALFLHFAYMRKSLGHYIIIIHAFINVFNRNLFPLVFRTGTSTVKMPGNQQKLFVNFIVGDLCSFIIHGMKQIYCHRRLSRDSGGMPGSAPFENPMRIQKNMNVSTKSIDNMLSFCLFRHVY